MHGKSQTQHTRQTAEVTSCSGKRQTEREDERQTETGLRNEEQVRRDVGGGKPPYRGTCKDKYTETYKGDSYFGTGRRSLILTALFVIRRNFLKGFCDTIENRKRGQGCWPTGDGVFSVLNKRCILIQKDARCNWVWLYLRYEGRKGQVIFYFLFFYWTSVERSGNRKPNSPGTE